VIFDFFLNRFDSNHKLQSDNNKIDKSFTEAGVLQQPKMKRALA
jgi:hypothetical protein